jgi:nucleoside-diphosphate-sugar epimerase
MILITGGTGFIGSRVILRFVQGNVPFKVLLRPKKEMTRLPLDLPMQVVVSSLTDRRSLRSVLSGVTTILHFASAENEMPNPDFEAVEVDGTDVLTKAAKDARVKRILYLSRIGADINSIYPIFRAKGLAEKIIRSSELDYQILRLTDVFGEGDHFVDEFSRFIRSAPGLLPIPERGEPILQPLWVEDLISAIFILINKTNFENKVISLGGGEYFDLRSILSMILQANKKRRLMVPISPAYLRLYNLWFRQSRGGFPLSNKWLDLLAMNRTCALDSLPRSFNMLPGRINQYLENSQVFE